MGIGPVCGRAQKQERLSSYKLQSICTRFSCSLLLIMTLLAPWPHKSQGSGVHISTVSSSISTNLGLGALPIDHLCQRILKFAPYTRRHQNTKYTKRTRSRMATFQRDFRPKKMKGISRAQKARAKKNWRFFTKQNREFAIFAVLKSITRCLDGG